MALIAFLAAAVSGWLAVHLVGPARGFQPRWAAQLAEAALGAGAGAGLASFVYFGLLVAGAASPALVLLADVAMSLALAALLWRKLTGSPQPEAQTAAPHPPFRWTWLLALVFGLCLLLTALAAVEAASGNPYGEWDAWAIWNLRARYLAGPGDTWHNAVSPLLTLTHPDYPLLTSSFIAHAWKAAGGRTDTMIPVATALLFSGSALALLVASLALLRGASLALLAGVVALANSQILKHSVSQYADVPLAFYYLATLVTVFFSAAAGGRRGAVLALAGFFASLAAWTKDEGILFAAVVLCCYLAVEWMTGGWKALLTRFPWLVGGALPGLLLVAGFKLFTAPAANPMLRQAEAGASVQLLTAGRLWILIQALAMQAWDLGSGLVHPLVILAILALALGVGMVPCHRVATAFGSLTLGMLFAGYCAACMLNPTLLLNEYVTPFERMFSHLWPSVVLLSGMVLRAPEDSALPSVPRVRDPRPRRHKQKRTSEAARRP